MDESKNIFNSPRIKTIYIPEHNMKSKKTRTAKKKTESDKKNDPNYIFNPGSGRYVLRTGAIGKKLVKELEDNCESINSESNQSTNSTMEEPNYKINKVSDRISLNLDNDKPKYQINLLRYGEEEKNHQTIIPNNVDITIPDNVDIIVPDSVDIIPQRRKRIIKFGGPRREITRFDDNGRKIESENQNLIKLRRKLKKRKKIANQTGNQTANLTRNKTNKTMYVYTDGAVSNNRRKSKLSVGGIGVYFGKNDHRNISERFQENPVTNQRAELYAIIRALLVIFNDRLHLQSNLKIVLFTDSMHSMNVISREWKAKVNLDLVHQAWKLIENMPNVEIKHIRAHTNKKDIHSIGNAMADRLATEGKAYPISR